MITFVVFSYSETLESMLVEYAATEMGYITFTNLRPTHPEQKI